jgi:hypothetical protein
MHRMYDRVQLRVLVEELIMLLWQCFRKSQVQKESYTAWPQLIVSICYSHCSGLHHDALIWIPLTTIRVQKITWLASISKYSSNPESREQIQVRVTQQVLIAHLASGLYMDVCNTPPTVFQFTAKGTDVETKQVWLQGQEPRFKSSEMPGVVAHPCNPCYSGGIRRRITVWAWPGQKYNTISEK